MKALFGNDLCVCSEEEMVIIHEKIDWLSCGHKF